jgi:hypothetical protein
MLMLMKKRLPLLERLCKKPQVVIPSEVRNLNSCGILGFLPVDLTPLKAGLVGMTSNHRFLV